VSAGGARAGAAAPLQPRKERGWRRGLANLLHAELRAWTGTRTWWLQLLVWLMLLNGLLVVPLVLLRDEFAAQGQAPLEAAYDMYFTFAALAPAVGAIIMAHGAIITERQLGTAAWVLSKPVSRSAFVLAKFTAAAAGLLVTAAVVPGMVAYAVLSLEAGGALPAAAFASGAALAALAVLFYLALTILLGTLLRARGAVLALPLVLLFGADLAVGAWPRLAEVGPWLLGRYATLAAQG
jgi:ABC-2 type transport system permease protein